MSSRVVITGMGVVSPNGMGKAEFCRATLAGKSGVKRISRFNPSGLPVQIAGEIPDFDEFAWVDARERKHVSRVVPLVIAASSEAIRDAGIDPASLSIEEKRNIGVVLGTGGGAQEFSEEQYRLWHSGQEKRASLFAIPSGTMGTLSSEVNMRFGFRGYSHVVTGGARLQQMQSATPISIFRQACCRFFSSAEWIRRLLQESLKAIPCCGH